MEIWEYIRSSVSSFQTFDNYINGQPAVISLRNNCTNIPSDAVTLVTADSGNGVTHLLNAVCNKWISLGKKVVCYSARSIVYILKKLKSHTALKGFRNYLLLHDLLVVDSIQYFYRKSRRYTGFLLDLFKEFREAQKPVIMGCSKPQKDFTRPLKNAVTINPVHIKPLSGIDVFRILKHLCEFECHIPESLLYAISSYNGSVNEYINCLVSLRFKTRCNGTEIPDVAWEELDRLFSLKSYFPKQQFRKGFVPFQLQIAEDEKIPVGI
jgi:chromosomal replication initiation ATPase DnaA